MPKDRQVAATVTKRHVSYTYRDSAQVIRARTTISRKWRELHGYWPALAEVTARVLSRLNSKHK